MRHPTPLARGKSRTFAASSRDRILQSAKSLFAAKGYEKTSTATIARTAGTSESQMMKHFGSKDGLLAAIFEEHWQRINWSARQAIKDLTSPSEKLLVLSRVVMSALDRDPELKLLMLLEGRRVRKEGQMISLAQGYLEFVRLTDDVLGEMRDGGLLRPEVHLQAMRSALMGALEGLMRDQLLARRARFPAHYGEEELREAFSGVLTSFIRPTTGSTHFPSSSSS
jgi:AcrR family transcriptional regulator